MPTTTIIINNKCSQLIVTTRGDPITGIDGRLTGNNVNFNTFSYDQLKMKRKAQVLLYTKEQPYTKEQSYSYITKNRGYYSQSKLLDFINSRSQKCPNIPSSSSCSGVFGSNGMIYYNDPNVPYYKSI